MACSTYAIIFSNIPYSKVDSEHLQTEAVDPHTPGNADEATQTSVDDSTQQQTGETIQNPPTPNTIKTVDNTTNNPSLVTDSENKFSRVALYV
jgi:hypothetical protein